jgi:hypothetical protein
VFLQRIKRANNRCRQALPITPAAEIDRCLPSMLPKLGFRATEVAPGSHGRAFAIIERRAS